MRNGSGRWHTRTLTEAFEVGRCTLGEVEEGEVRDVGRGERGKCGGVTGGPVGDDEGIVGVIEFLSRVGSEST